LDPTFESFPIRKNTSRRELETQSEEYPEEKFRALAKSFRIARSFGEKKKKKKKKTQKKKKKTQKKKKEKKKGLTGNGFRQKTFQGSVFPSRIFPEGCSRSHRRWRKVFGLTPS